MLIQPSNNPSGNDAPAIQTALNSLTSKGGEVVLGNGKWYIKSPITIPMHSIRLRGETCGLSPYDYGSGGNWGCQLIGIAGMDMITVNNFGYVEISDMSIWLPTGATVAATAIKLDQCFLPKIRNVRTTNYSTGIKLTRNTDVEISSSYISGVNNTVATNGIDIDSESDVQNQTVFVDKVITAFQNCTSSIGFNLHGKRIADVKMIACEANFSQIGFMINGASGITEGFGGDIHLIGCVADGCVNYGFQVNGLGAKAQVHLDGGWSANASTNVYVSNSSKNVNVRGMQIYGGTNGIYYQNGSSGNATDNMLCYQTGNGIVVDASNGVGVYHNRGIQKDANNAHFIHGLNGSIACSASGNQIDHASVVGGFATGIYTEVGSDYWNVIGNNLAIPTGAAGTPYALNLGNNVHTVQVGAL